MQTVHKGSIEISLYPQRLWHTSPKEELDYTFVACESPTGVEVRLWDLLCTFPCPAAVAASSLAL